MKRIRLFLGAALLPLALSGCATLPSASPAPLAQTALDERALLIGWQAFNTALAAVDALVTAGAVKPGSAEALKLDAAIEAVQTALNGAQAARAALSASDYAAALLQAQTAFTALQVSLKGFSK